MNKKMEASELVLNEDGSVYHLHLKPEHIADDIIIVGDQDRVKDVSKHFDSIEFQRQPTNHLRCFTECLFKSSLVL